MPPERHRPLAPLLAALSCAAVLACGEVEPSVITDLSVRPLPNMPTFLEVTWRTPVPAAGKVWFGLDEALGSSAASLALTPTSHRALLKGMPAEAEVSFRVEAAPADGSPAASARGIARTGALPAAMPLFKLAGRDPKRAEGGYTLFPANSSRDSWMVIVDPLGRPVWYHLEERSDGPNPIFSARLSLDGEAVLFIRRASSAAEDGQIVRVAIDDLKTTVTSVPGGHTAFVEREPGKYAVLAYTVRSFAGGARKLRGDLIMEVDEGGTARKVWDLFDHVTPSLGKAGPMGWYPGDASVEDWSHVNFLAHDPADDAYLITASGQLEAVIKVSRATGKMTWVLGGEAATLASQGAASLINKPHSVQRVASAILVFNRGDLVPGACSWAAEIAIDVKAATAREAWSYRASPCYQVYYLGDALRLQGGNTLVNWATAGHLEEVTPQGDVVWSLKSDLGQGFGFLDRFERL